MKLLLLSLLITISKSTQAQTIDKTDVFYIREVVLFSYSGPYDLAALKSEARKILQLKGAKVCSPLLAKQYGDLKIINLSEYFGGMTEMGFQCQKS